MLTIVVMICALLCFSIKLISYIRRKRAICHSIAFFHPFCDGFGGGERVLWCIVRTLLTDPLDSVTRSHVSHTSIAKKDRLEVTVYCTRQAAMAAEDLLLRVKDRFGIDLIKWCSFEATTGDKKLPQFANRSLKLVPLYSASLLKAENYQRMTVLFQNVASILVAIEALVRQTPHLYVDTTGFAFTFAVASFFGCYTSSYIHYPTVSADMILRVKERGHLLDNHLLLAGSAAFTHLKIWYYEWLAWAYGCCGGFLDSCVVNSSWTHSHIVDLMTFDSARRSENTANRGSKFSPMYVSKALHSMSCCRRLPKDAIKILFPPCDVEKFQRAARPLSLRLPHIVSLAQFRPEKNQSTQLLIFARLLQLFKAKSRMPPSGLKLIICGSVRNSKDEDVLLKLRLKAAELGLGDRVQFVVNLNFELMTELLGTAKVGLHTMEDEHFGIAVVELLAAGLIVVAHNSGGPRLDILQTSDFVIAEKEAPKRTQVEVEERLVILDSICRDRSAQSDDDCVAASFGFLCKSVDGFAKAIFQGLNAFEDEQMQQMLQRAKASLDRFPGNDRFGISCIRSMNVHKLCS